METEDKLRIFIGITFLGIALIGFILVIYGILGMLPHIDEKPQNIKVPCYDGKGNRIMGLECSELGKFSSEVEGYNSMIFYGGLLGTIFAVFGAVILNSK